jgi:hypothetical protein
VSARRDDTQLTRVIDRTATAPKKTAVVSNGSKQPILWTAILLVIAAASAVRHADAIFIAAAVAALTINAFTRTHLKTHHDHASRRRQNQ